jgi:hypothetical protein
MVSSASTLRLLLAARSPEQLRDTVPAVHRILVDARAQIMEETLGNLSAFYAMFPGNHKFNVSPCGSRRIIMPASPQYSLHTPGIRPLRI